MLTSPLTWPRLLFAAALLIAAASVFVFSGSEPAPATRADRETVDPTQYGIRVAPQQVRPTSEIRIHILNGGRENLSFGSIHTIERLGGTGWVDVTSEFYGEEQGFLAYNMSARAGESSPADLIEIPATIEPGVYRVVKIAAIDNPRRAERGSEVRLVGEFVVS